MRAVAQQYRVKSILPHGSDEKIIRYLEENNFEYEFFEGRIDLGEAKTFRQKIKRRLNDFSANYSLAKYLSRFDLINSAIQIDAAPWNNFALILYLVLKANVFITLHTAVSPISRWRKIIWKTKLAILNRFENFHLNASNLDVRKSLRPFLSEADYQRVNVIYSSFNKREIQEIFNDDITGRDFAGKYNFPIDKIWICNVGQFIERKGCWVFLEAIKNIQSRRSDLFFFWLGTAAPDYRTLEKINEYNLGDTFRLLSAEEIGSKRKDLLTIWKASDIFVLPSFQEGLPMALIEAMALGKACIASDINAIPEALEHLVNGILITAGDAEKLAAAIEKLADDSELRRILGENAKESVFENFEEQITGQEMLKLYEEALR